MDADLFSKEFQELSTCEISQKTFQRLHQMPGTQSDVTSRHFELRQHLQPIFIISYKIASIWLRMRQPPGTYYS